MNDYLFLMHEPPGAAAGSAANWPTYLAWLRGTGQFDGGSSIGGGVCVSRSGAAVDIAAHLVGYLRVRAGSLDDARKLLVGNPVFEAGGTVEIRELPEG